jgi:hypothetical protein
MKGKKGLFSMPDLETAKGTSFVYCRLAPVSANSAWQEIQI